MHPAPDPVARTTAPHRITATVTPSVIQANLMKECRARSTAQDDIIRGLGGTERTEQSSSHGGTENTEN